MATSNRYLLLKDISSSRVAIISREVLMIAQYDYTLCLAVILYLSLLLISLTLNKFILWKSLISAEYFDCFYLRTSEGSVYLVSVSISSRALSLR